MERMLRIPEAAERMSVSPSTVRRLIARGDLPAYRILRAVVIRPEDIVEYLQRVKIPIDPPWRSRNLRRESVSLEEACIRGREKPARRKSSSSALADAIARVSVPVPPQRKRK